MISFYSDLPTIGSDIYRTDQIFTSIHPTACFLTVLDGTLVIETGQEQYPLEKEMVFYIAPDTPYRILPGQTILLLYTELHPCFLLQTLGFRYKYIALHSSKNPLKDFSELITYLADISISLPEDAAHTGCLALGKTCEMLHYIEEAYLNPIAIQLHPDKVQDKIWLLQRFLNARYHTPVSLTETAAALGITPPYLSNFIKKNLGSTFQEYLNTFRMEAAELYIKYTLESPGRIAALCGFSNLPAFLKVWKDTRGMSLEDYTSAHRRNIHDYIRPEQLVCISNYALKMDYLFHYTNRERHYIRNAPSSSVLKVSLNTTLKKPFNRSWNELVHLGNASDFENAAYRRHLAALQNDLHFRYGKITGIFCYMELCKSLYTKTQDFSKAFRILDYLMEIRIRPFLELSNKPFHLYKEDEHEIPDYDTYLTPEPYDHMLFSVLPSFLKACINRYGYEEVSTWKFELWRRYNPAMTSLESPAVYFRRFQKTAAIIKAIVPSCEFGGPCFNTYLATEKFEQMLEEFKNRDTLMPDFFSACYFPYIPDKPYTEHEPSGSFAAQSPDLMSKKVSELRKAMKQTGFEDTPLYITEFGAYLSIGNFINDSVYPAVFLFHQVVRNMKTADVLSYWVVSDLSLEYGNYALPLFGGNGLMSKDGIRKPAYHAFGFLNMLGGTLIGSGDYYIATRSENGAIQILVYYITNLNLTFSRSPKNQELLHYPYSPFEDVPPLDMHFTLTNLDEGDYTIKERPLDLSHGNALSTWSTLNYSSSLHPSDTEYIRQESRIPVYGKTESLHKTFHLHARLNTNEAKLFTLRLQGGNHVSK